MTSLPPTFASDTPPPLVLQSMFRSIQPPPNLLVRDFHDVFICFVCGGYKIEATTINECMHSYCRTCIVKYLEVRHYCPQCFQKKYAISTDGSGRMIRIGVANNNGGPQSVVNSPRIITVQNLHLDKALAAIIYKLVPGLYKREMRDVQRFYEKQTAESLSTLPIPTIRNSFEKVHFNKQDWEISNMKPDDSIYLDAEEPISLSLEYHPKELEYVRNIRAENIPKVKYLQCPGGLRIFHLEKFLCSKFSLNPTFYQIDVLHGDEIIRKDLNLMDVVYTFEWKMDAPLQLFYRILSKSYSPKRKLSLTRNILDESNRKKVRFANATISQTVGHSKGEIKTSISSVTKTKDIMIANAADSTKLIGIIKSGIDSNKQNNSKEKSINELDSDKVFCKPQSTLLLQSNRKAMLNSDKTETQIVQSTDAKQYTDAMVCNNSVSNGQQLAKEYKQLRSSNSVRLPQEIPSGVSLGPSTRNNMVTVIAGTSAEEKPTKSKVEAGPQQSNVHGVSPKSNPVPVTTTQCLNQGTRGLKMTDIPDSKPRYTKSTAPDSHQSTVESGFDGIQSEQLKYPTNQLNSGPNNCNIVSSNSFKANTGDGKFIRNVESKSVDPEPKTLSIRPTCKNITDGALNRKIEVEKYEYIKNIGLAPINEVKLANKNFEAAHTNKDAEQKQNLIDNSIFTHSKKKKRSQNAIDFPFADSKRRKVDYDLAISASNVPKTGYDSKNQKSPTDSLKMKFIKVTDKRAAEVKAIPKQYTTTDGPAVVKEANQPMPVNHHKSSANKYVQDTKSSDKDNFSHTIVDTVLPGTLQIREQFKGFIPPTKARGVTATNNGKTLERTPIATARTGYANQRAPSTPRPQRDYGFDPTTILKGNDFRFPLDLQMTYAMGKPSGRLEFGTKKVNATRDPLLGNTSMANKPNSLNLCGSVKPPIPPLVTPNLLGKCSPVPPPMTRDILTTMPKQPPMVEIIPSASDLLEMGLGKLAKANRPPPPTIPLVKIRRAISSTPGDQLIAKSLDNNKRQMNSTNADSVGKATEKLIIQEKRSSAAQKPLPKLNEISKICRNGEPSSFFRLEQSASVRNVPNPSALAFRNHIQPLDKNIH